MVYLFIGSFFAYLSFLEIFLRKAQNSKFSFILVFIILFFLSFLRFEVGADWLAYLAFYTGSGPVESTEIGYRSLNNFFAKLDFPYFVFLAVVSAITLGFIYNAVKDMKYKMIILYVYFSELFLYYNFSGMRQGLAIAITLFATKFIISREFTKFCLLVLLASTFHVSALIFLIAYFIYDYEFTKKRVLFLSSIIVFSFLFINNIVELILQLVDSRHLFFYFSIAEVSENNTTNFMIGLLKRSVILIIFFLIPNHLKNDYGLKNFIKIYLIGYFIYALFYTINEDIGARLSSYFLFMDILIISIFFQLNIKIKYKLLIFLTIFSMYMYKLYGYSQLPEYSYKVFL